ncbi:histidine kinase, partial [candidate division GN15 bacterium]|nr:histidine kinase [candidate division GN15 bacterium]
MESIEKLVDELGYRRPFHEFQNLMHHRVREVLLVSSLYDSYILEEDGRLYELILSGYIDLNLSHAPGLTRVSSGGEAVRMASGEKHYDLIITTMNLGDMDAPEFARVARDAGIGAPIILLAYDKREIIELRGRDRQIFEKVFIWQGDFRILIAIIKFIEDQMNLKPDTDLIGVQSIILVEDNVDFYSYYLPLIYTEVLRHHQGLISEGINTAHKLLRMRARPKILLCSTFEEAWRFYEQYQENVLGVISDIEFPRNGKKDPKAGIRLSKQIRESHFDVPILLQSDSEELEKVAGLLGASFVLKSSPVLLNSVRDFMRQYFSFGDFVFHMPDNREVGRAADLRELERQLHIIPDE